MVVVSHFTKDQEADRKHVLDSQKNRPEYPYILETLEFTQSTIAQSNFRGQREFPRALNAIFFTLYNIKVIS